MSRPARLGVLALVAVAAAAFVGFSFARYLTFHNDTFDLAFYARLAWGLAHGDTYEPLVGAHVFGLRLSFLLPPLGLLGRFFGTVPVLLVVQGLAVALTAWPLARIGARRLGDAGAYVGAAAFLLYPNLVHVTSEAFHPGTVAVLPLAFALDALDRCDTRAFTWSILGVLACREDLALCTFVLALLFVRAAPRTERRTGIVLAALSVGYLLLFMLVLQPIFAPRNGSLDLHFAKWGESPLDVVFGWVTSPAELFAHLSRPDRALYLPKVLLPLALLPLLAPRWLLPALPVLAINLLSDYPTLTRIDSHYLTPAVPVLVVAALGGAERLVQWTRAPAMVVSVVIACALVAHVLAGGTPGTRGFDLAAFRSDARTDAARRAVAAVPERASVQAPAWLLPHFAERTFLFRGPPPDREADFVVLDSAYRERYAHHEDLLRTVEEPVLRRWLQREDHALVAAPGDLLVLRRGKHPRTGLGARAVRGRASPESGTLLTTCLAVLGARPTPAGVALDLVARGPCPGDLAVRIGTGDKPRRVDLLFDGRLSPVHLRRGDRLVSEHTLDARTRASVARHGLRVGLLRSGGARVDHADPTAVDVPLSER